MKIYLDKTNEQLNLFLELRDFNSNNREDKEMYNNSQILVKATRATLYIDEGKYNLALNTIKKAFDDPTIAKDDNFKIQAYCIIGIAYLYTKKPAQALENFEKAGLIIKRMESAGGAKNKYVGKYHYYSPMEGSTIAYIHLNKYQEAIQLSDSLFNKIENEYRLALSLHGSNPNGDFIYKFFKNRILCYYALANIKLKNRKTARSQLDSIKQYIPEISSGKIHQDFGIYYTVEMEYNLLVSNYKKVKEYAKLLTDTASTDHHTYTYLQTNLLLSKAIDAEGRSKEAYDMLYDLYQTNDSINAVSFANEFAEMETKYELKEAKFIINEANLKLKNTRMLLFVISISLILSILWGYTIWKNKKILKEKNIQLYNHYKEIELRNKKITELQEIHKDITSSINQDEDIHSDLMEKLAEYITTSKVYLNSEVTREEVALAIGTNRQYLIEAIKEKTGKTFNEYIYTYRLKYAYDLIVNNGEKTISDILQESGFHSRATFYNAFKEAYGMTPSELRNILH